MPQRPAAAGQARATQLASLFDAIPEGALVGTLSTGGSYSLKTSAANRHLRTVFGYAPDALDADVQPFADVHFADLGARRTFFDRIANQGHVNDYLLRMRRVDGSSVWIEVTAQLEAVDSAGGRALYILVRDVSTRRKLDDQSRDVYHQLLQSEKMAALGQTISGVAHELNNPLATILSWAERLSERRLDETSRRGATVIRGEAERAARIVRNLLTFARKRQSTRAVVDLNHVIRETLGLRAYEQRVTNIKVVEELDPSVPHVFVDAHQIQQVLLNLVINAEQAMLPARGSGSITVRTLRLPDRESVAIEVHDDGPGVPPDVKGKIFDPFFTTKDVGKGTGLGLTVAYAIVQEHGGSIQVDSPPEGGASFRVVLPCSGVQEAPPAQTSTAPPMDALRGASVLVVDDEEALAAAIGEALTDAGLQVSHASDGEQALARITSTRYDLVICDLKMPRVDGMTLYRSLRSAPPGVAPPIIFVTGDVVGTDAERFLEETQCRWLAKPFRLAELLRTVRETLS